MASSVPLLLLLLSCSSISPSAHAGVDDHQLKPNYMLVATSSLKPNAVCSGFRVNPPSANLTNWVPVHRPHGPCSGDGDVTPPSAVDVLRWDEHRAGSIQRKLSGEVGDEKSIPKGETVTSKLDSGPKAMFGVGGGGGPTSSAMGQQRLSMDDPAATGGGGGLPGVSQTVVLDTASDVAWVQCAPCPIPQCYAQPDVLYDPSKSSSFAALPCNSPACLQLGPYANGCINNQCQYRVQYRDGSSTMGAYISDVLSLTPTANFVFQFGCSHAERGSFDTTAAGIMALGGASQSLISQTKGSFSRVFSYCIPPTTSHQGFFTLGVSRHAVSRFVLTPLLKNTMVPPTFYMVRLQAITVAGQRLNIPPAVFAAGAAMDSRTLITRLPPTAYNALRAAFRAAMAAYRMAAPKGILDTCYDFTGVRNINLPRVALVFDRNAAVELDPSGILYSGCLAFAATAADVLPGIIGNVQQNTLEVLYNVPGGLVGFRRGAC